MSTHEKILLAYFLYLTCLLEKDEQEEIQTLLDLDFRLFLTFRYEFFVFYFRVCFYFLGFTNL